MSNEIFIGAVFFILGLIPAYYFYVKSIKIKEPVWSIKSNNLISGSISTLEKLKITYGKLKIENLTISKILFLNHGSATIDKRDIQTVNPLRISTKECNILDVSILSVSNPSNNFRVNIDETKKNAFIDFDYVDLNQGVVIQVVHTGLSSDNVKIDGDIKGVEGLKQLDSKVFQDVSKSRTDFRNFIIFGLITLVFWGILLLSPDYFNSMSQSSNSMIRFVTIIFGLVSIISTFGFGINLILYIVGLFIKLYRIPTSLAAFSE